METISASPTLNEVIKGFTGIQTTGNFKSYVDPAAAADTPTLTFGCVIPAGESKPIPLVTNIPSITITSGDTVEGDYIYWQDGKRAEIQRALVNARSVSAGTPKGNANPNPPHGDGGDGDPLTRLSGTAVAPVTLEIPKLSIVSTPDSSYFDLIDLAVCIMLPLSFYKGNHWGYEECAGNRSDRFKFDLVVFNRGRGFAAINLEKIS